jgi:hypothetical protein
VDHVREAAELTLKTAGLGRSLSTPVVLTVNGKAAAAAYDAETYQHPLDLAAEPSAAEGIRQGLEDQRNGRTRSARAVFDEHNIRVDLTERALQQLVGRGSECRSGGRCQAES